MRPWATLLAGAGALGAGALTFLWLQDATAETPAGEPLNHATGDERLDFILAVWTAIQLHAGNLSFRSRQMVLAHAAYESGWGNSTAARRGYNLFNITGQVGPTVTGGDQECDAAGHCVSIVQHFRAYPSYSESVADYLTLLAGARYGAAYAALLLGDVDGFVYALSSAGYFTLPVGQYLSTYRGVLSGVEKRMGALGLVESMV